MPKTESPRIVGRSAIVRRAAARTLKRLKQETVLRPIGPICVEEWQCCRDIIAEEMLKLPPNESSSRKLRSGWWTVYHPDGLEHGLHPKRFKSEKIARQSAALWNKHYPGHRVIAPNAALCDGGPLTKQQP